MKRRDMLKGSALAAGAAVVGLPTRAQAIQPCCERDHDGDGDCDRHPARKVQALFSLALPGPHSELPEQLQQGIEGLEAQWPDMEALGPVTFELFDSDHVRGSMSMWAATLQDIPLEDTVPPGRPEAPVQLLVVVGHALFDPLDLPQGFDPPVLDPVPDPSLPVEVAFHGAGGRPDPFGVWAVLVGKCVEDGFGDAQLLFSYSQLPLPVGRIPHGKMAAFLPAAEGASACPLGRPARGKKAGGHASRGDTRPYTDNPLV